MKPIKSISIVVLLCALSFTITAHYISFPTLTEAAENLAQSSPLTPPPSKDAYHFNSYVKYTINILDKRKPQKNVDISYDISVTPDLGQVGIGMESSDPKMNKAMDFMIIDNDENKMYTFMSNNGKKSQMGMSMNLFGNDGATDRTLDRAQYEIYKLPSSRTIANVSADGYVCISDDDSTTVWISKTSQSSFPVDPEVLTQTMQRRKRRGSQDILWSVPEIKERLEEGAIVLAYTWKSNNNRDVVKFTITSWGSRNKTFNAGEYESIM